MATTMVPAKSDRARFDFLKSASSNGQADLDAGKGINNAEQLTEINGTIDPYRTAMLNTSLNDTRPRQ